MGDTRSAIAGQFSVIHFTSFVQSLNDQATSLRQTSVHYSPPSQLVLDYCDLPAEVHSQIISLLSMGPMARLRGSDSTLRRQLTPPLQSLVDEYLLRLILYGWCDATDLPPPLQSDSSDDEPLCELQGESDDESDDDSSNLQPHDTNFHVRIQAIFLHRETTGSCDDFGP